MLNFSRTPRLLKYDARNHYNTSLSLYTCLEDKSHFGMGEGDKGLAACLVDSSQDGLLLHIRLVQFKYYSYKFGLDNSSNSS